MVTRTRRRSTNEVRPWLVLGAMCAALIVVVIDVTVLHVAAPAISFALHPSATELLWIIDIYPLVVAPLLLTVGVAGDRWGRKRILIIGLIVFGVCSVPAAFASSAFELIVFRAAMGIGAALIMPSTMSIIRAVFPDRKQRIRAVGLWSACSAAGAAAGPLVGGILVEQLWWGAVFLINVPLVLLVIVYCVWVVPESKSAQRRPWDIPSVVLAMAAVFGIVFGVKEFANQGPDMAAAVSTSVGVVALVWFVVRQHRRITLGKHPLLNVWLFRNATFTLSVIAVLLAMFGVVGLDLFFSQYLQEVLGLSPVEAALRITSLAVGMVAGSLAAPRIINRGGTRFSISGGLGLAALSLVPLLWLGTQENLSVFVVCLALQGIGLEVALVAANDTIVSAVPVDNAGEASGIEETAYELGGGLGVAVLGSAIAVAYTASIPAIAGLSPEQMGTVRDSLPGAESLAATLPPDVGGQVITIAHEAFMDGLDTGLVISFVIIAATAVSAALFVRHHATAENDV